MALKFPVNLVEVVWHDACTDSGWETHDKTNITEELMVTIGFLVARSENVIIIASSLDQESHLMSNSRIKIPVGMIKTIRELSVSYKKEKKVEVPVEVPRN